MDSSIKTDISLGTVSFTSISLTMGRISTCSYLLSRVDVPLNCLFLFLVPLFFAIFSLPLSLFSSAVFSFFSLIFPLLKTYYFPAFRTFFCTFPSFSVTFSLRPFLMFPCLSLFFRSSPCSLVYCICIFLVFFLFPFIISLFLLHSSC